jgi:uncharacterized protein
METNGRRIASGTWQWRQGTGLERFELWRTEGGWLVRGVIVAVCDPESQPESAEARYEVACGNDWRTERVAIDVRAASGTRSLALAAKDGCWLADGREVEAVRGCVDVDLGWSPSTNTLPIRRLGLAVGAASGPVTAAWVRFPTLDVEPLPQEYRRLADDRYLYTSRGGAFRAELRVDAEGLVIDYEGGWRRVAER